MSGKKKHWLKFTKSFQNKGIGDLGVNSIFDCAVNGVLSPTTQANPDQHGSPRFNL